MIKVEPNQHLSENMKVAFCLRGAMSKVGGPFSYSNDLYIDRPYVNYISCFESIKKHIIEVNPKHCFDFYIHSWNPDLQDKLISLYQPKKSSFENNALFNADILARCRVPGDFGGVSQALSIQRVVNLLDVFYDYDLVIIYRPDVILWKDMILEKYDPQTIYVNGSENPDHIGDFHMIMNLDNARQFRHLYDSTVEGNPHQSHFWTRNYVVNFMKQSLLMDDIIAGWNQEVLRKINAVVKSGRIDIPQLETYGLQQEEILQYNN